jgi:antitoxin (DNA-binding transcriptional repressor) of toxin-antitoxin stability system
MTIHVNIGEAKARLSELIAAAVAGVILNKAGVPAARIIPDPAAVKQRHSEIAARRKAFYGKYAGHFSKEELTIPDERVDDDLDERFERKFGYPPTA